MWNLWFYPYAHVLPFSFTPSIHFIRSISRSATFLYFFVRLYESSDPITFMYCNGVYSLYTTATAISPCFLTPFLDVICVNVTPTDSLCMSCIKYIYFSSVLVNCVSYYPPPNFILRRSTTSCVGPSWTCVCVFTVLIFPISCFYFSFILVYL